jgi:pyrimidine operon attenuation protein/uracil phosphoribosyltransferase
LLVRQADAAATVHRQQLALLETAESVGLAAMAFQVRPDPFSQLHKQAQVVVTVGLAELAAQQHRELAVMAVLVVAAESVATAESVTKVLAQTVQTAVSVALLGLVVPAVQPHLEWLDQVVPADLAAMAVTVAKAVFLATVVTLAMLDQVALVVLAARRHRELPALMDLADEPEMVAPAEMAETETSSRAQAPMVAMVETAATLVQQAPATEVTDSPVTAATAVPAEPVGPELMEVTPTLPMPLAQVLLAGLVAMAATAERQRPELLVTAAMPELVAMAATAATVSQSEQIQTQELAAMLALAVTAETAERQHLEPLAMVATEPMLARPETADLRQAAATAATAGTAPAVATEARAVVPLASTATVATVDLPRTERTEVTLARLLEHWAVAAATAGLREQLVAPLEMPVQVQDQQEPAEP